MGIAFRLVSPGLFVPVRKEAFLVAKAALRADSFTVESVFGRISEQHYLAFFPRKCFFDPSHIHTY